MRNRASSTTSTATESRKRPSVLAIAIVLGALLLAGVGGAYAHGKIGTKDLKNNAVTSAKVKNKTIKTADLKPSARGSKATVYVTGSHDFASDPDLTAILPGSWTNASVANSDWTVQVAYFGGTSGRDLIVRDLAVRWEYEVRLPGDSRHAKVTVTDPYHELGTVYQVRIYRTASTNVVSGVATS